MKNIKNINIIITILLLILMVLGQIYIYNFEKESIEESTEEHIIESNLIN